MALVPAVSSQSIWKFSPQTIPGLSLWLDGTDSSSITTGSTLTWRDKSVNGYNATQSNAGNQPTVSGDGLVFSNASNKYLTTSYTANISTETMFALITPSASALTASSTFSITSTSTTSINIGSRSNTTSSLVGMFVTFSALSSASFGLALNTVYYVLSDNWVSPNTTSTITLATLAAISTPISTTGNITSSTSAVGTYYFILGATSLTGRNFMLYGGRSYLYGNGGNQFNGTTLLPSGKMLLEMTYSGANSAISYLNGRTLAGGVFSTTYSSGGNTTIGGSSSVTTSGFDGTIYEIICYNSVLSFDQRQQIEGYLLWKWSLQANSPTTHPYRLSNGIMPFSRIFTPFEISGLSLWLDAYDSSSISFSSGSTISQWTDKSGNGYHAVPNVGSGTYSSTGLGGLPTVGITSTGYMKSSVPAGTFASNITLFVIFQKTGANNTYDTVVTRTGGALGNIPSPIDYYITGTTASRLIGNGTASGGYTVTDTVFRTTTPTMYYVNVASSAPTKWNEGLNGVVAQTTTAATTYGDTATYVYIGSRGDTTTKMTGNISEIIMYNTTLTTQQRQQVEGYLSKKWGITLASTHSFSKYIPSVPTPFNSLVVSPGFWFDASNTSSITSGNGLTPSIPLTGDPLCYLDTITSLSISAPVSSSSFTLTGSRNVNVAGRTLILNTNGGGLTVGTQYYVTSDTWVSGTTSTITLTAGVSGATVTTNASGLTSTGCKIKNYFLNYSNPAFEQYIITSTSITAYVRNDGSYGFNTAANSTAYPVGIPLSTTYAGYLSYTISEIPPKALWNDYLGISSTTLYGDGTFALPNSTTPAPLLLTSGSITTSSGSKIYSVISVAASVYGYTAYTLSICIGYVSNTDTTITFNSCSSGNNGTFNIRFISGSIVIVNNPSGVLETNSIGTATFTLGTSVTLPITTKPSSFGLDTAGAVAIANSVVSSGNINNLIAPGSLTISSISSIVGNAVTVACTTAPSTVGISVGSLVSIASTTTPCITNIVSSQSTFNIASTSGTSISISGRTNITTTLAGLWVAFTSLSSTVAGLVLNKSYYVLTDSWTTGATSTITVSLATGGTAITISPAITSGVGLANSVLVALNCKFMTSGNFALIPVITDITGYSNIANASLGFGVPTNGPTSAGFPFVGAPDYVLAGNFPILKIEGGPGGGTSLGITGTNGSSSLTTTIATRATTFPRKLTGYLIYFSSITGTQSTIVSSAAPYTPYYILSDDWVSGNTSIITLSASFGGSVLTLNGTMTASTSAVYPYVMIYGNNTLDSNTYVNNNNTYGGYITNPNYWTVTALSNVATFSITFNMYGNLPSATGAVTGTITTMSSPTIWALSSVDNTNKTITFNMFNNIPSGTITTPVGLAIHTTWRIGDKFSFYSNGQNSFCYKYSTNKNTRYGPLQTLKSGFSMLVRFYGTSALPRYNEVKYILNDVVNYLIGINSTSIIATNAYATYSCATNPILGIPIVTNGVTTYIGTIVVGSVVNIFGFVNTLYNVTNAVVTSTTSNSITIASTLTAGTYTGINGYICLQNNPFFPDSSQLIGWKDLSGNGSDALFSQNPLTYGTTTNNSLSTLNFSSQIPITLPYLPTNSSPTTNDFSIFGVFYINTNSTIQQLLSKTVQSATSTPTYVLLATNTSNQVVLTYNITGVSYTITSATIPSSGWYILTVVANRSINSSFSNYIRLNGVSGGTFITPSIGSLSSTGIWVLGGSGFDGNIAEVLYSNINVTNTQSQKLEGYLSKKWGIALPTTHPYYSLMP